MPNFPPDMFIRSNIYCRQTVNYVAYDETYTKFLQWSIQQQEQTGLESYHTTVSEYTVVPATTKCKAIPVNCGDDLLNDPPTKDKQKEEVMFNSPIYQCLRGQVTSITASVLTRATVFNFLSAPTIHQPLINTLLSLGPSFSLEVETIRQKNDSDLRKHSIVQYSYIAPKPTQIPHAMRIKIKMCAWSSKNIAEKLPSTILLRCFVSIVKKDLLEIQKNEEKVTMDAKIN